MKRLLMVSTISRFLRDFLIPHAQHFRAQGWQVDALCKGTELYPECADAFDRLWEIEWSRNPLDPRNLCMAPAQIQELVQRERYDLVHVHTPVASFVTRYALRHRQYHADSKVIYTAHGFHFLPEGKPLTNMVFRSCEQIAGRWTDYLVVINQEDRDAAERYRLVSPERLRYMPGIGVDLNYYNPDAVAERDVQQLRSELRIPRESPLLLMVAEFNPGKRHQDALEAFARLSHANAHLAFAGEGKLLPSMQEYAEHLGIQSRVHFLGFRRDIPRLIRSACATLLPSGREGLPRAVMESLALGVPAIGTDVRGLRELVADGCGHLVKIGDIQGLTKAVERILTNPAEAAAMGKRGRERMAKYSLTAVIAQHERLYDEALRMERASVQEAA